MIPIACDLQWLRLSGVVLMGLLSFPDWGRADCLPQLYRWKDVCQIDREDGWLAWGGELRARVESLDQPDFGMTGREGFTSTSQRVLAHSDFHPNQHLRLFLQGSYAQENGREPVARPFDESDPDLAQGFIDIKTERLLVRWGRQELDMAGNRLVGLRDGTTLRRAFDGGWAGYKFNEVWSASAFSVNPVRIEGDAFDDSTNREERFYGFQLLSQMSTASSNGLFLFARERPSARYLNIAGEEKRYTVGYRRTESTVAWDYAFQGAVQFGEIERQNIRAAGMALDTGWRPLAKKSVRLGAGLGVGSGERDPHDHTVNTFDPIYPNLAFFTAAPLWYPANERALELNISDRIGWTSWKLSTVHLSRSSINDTLYTNAGIPLPLPATGARSAAWLCDFSVMITPISNFYVKASVVHGEALAAVKAAGGQNVNYLMAESALQF